MSITDAVVALFSQGKSSTKPRACRTRLARLPSAPMSRNSTGVGAAPWPGVRGQKVGAAMIDSTTLAQTVLDEIEAVVALMETPDQPSMSPEEKFAEWSARWPVPGLEQLKLVIERSFSDSLLSEESRPLRFRLVMHDRDKSEHLLGFHEFQRTRPVESSSTQEACCRS